MAISQFSACIVAKWEFITYLMLHILIKNISNVFVAIFPAATCSLRAMN